MTTKRSSFSMERKHGYGQYYIVKTTPKGKVTKLHTTDSQLFDDYTSNECSQSRLKRHFDWLYQVSWNYSRN